MGSRLSRLGPEGWEEVADTEIAQAADAVVRVAATAICGTDLHIPDGPFLARG